VVADGSRLEAANVIRHVKSLKGGVSAPKSVDFVHELPLTAAGEVNERRLRAPHRHVEGGREVH
jgi:acyl-CoA synthetase (AMP-forming)/AMP-acid ligase II